MKFVLLNMVLALVACNSFALEKKPSTPASEDSLFIYLIKQHWHTGIVFKVDDVDTTIWSEINNFRDLNYVDVGWGDEEFYQYEEDFDFGLAIKAICYPTPSVLRVEGFSFSIERYVELSDYALRVPVSADQLNILYKYISAEYYKNDQQNVEVLNEKFGGNIKFYRANDKYHLFNTCNTWIAEALEKAGFNINHSIVVLAQDLFLQAEEFGIVLKDEK